MATADAAWCVAAPGDFEWREWDGETVVFVHATGDTHALSADASDVLAAMIERRGESWPARRWMGVLMPASTGLDDVADDELLDFEHLLAGLEQIGLVRHSVP